MEMRVVLTGATGAIGREIAAQLARRRCSLILACRSREKALSLAGELREKYGVEVSHLPLDLTDSGSVKAAAESLRGVSIDAMIHNAGVMNPSFRKGNDGHEETLTVNYHNTKLLCELLLPAMNDGGAVVFTTSATRNWFPAQKICDDIPEPSFSRMKAYALSKKLLTLYAKNLSSRLKDSGIRVNCSDPGVVDTPMLSMGKWYDRLTDIFFRPFCFSPSMAARTAVKAMLSNHTGYIFHTPMGISKIRTGFLKRRLS